MPKVGAAVAVASGQRGAIEVNATGVMTRLPGWLRIAVSFSY